MKAFLSLTLLVLSSTFSLAQNAPTNCATVQVTGPAGIVNTGELASYTATVSNAEQHSLEYVWSLSAGRIKDGQGTASIRVIQPAEGLTVIVEVKGLPEGCPATAAVTQACGLSGPDPIKIYELGPNAFFTARNVAAVMLEHPNNQLYILAGDVERKNSPAFRQRQKSIVDLLSEFGVTSDRITISTVYSEVELFQFWRVPPGAENPRCEECDELEEARKQCPSISVTGPAGISLPEDIMQFSAKSIGDVPKEITFVWKVEGGVIVGGQHTSELRTRYTDRWKFKATVTVGGLTPGCPTQASEVLHMSGPEPIPEHLGAISSVTTTIDKTLLKRIGDSLISNKHSQLFVWMYVGSLPQPRISSLKLQLLRQIFLAKIDPSRITLNVSSEKARGVAFWRVPPGSSNPAP